MPSTYERGDSDGYRTIDRWEDGVGWLAHPAEDGQRASHAIRADGGVWLVDPLDAPGVDSLVADLGAVAGVLVLADYHTRDAAAFARRYDVPVTVPAWLSRVEDRVDAPVQRVGDSVAGFDLRRVRPLRAWRECVAYRERDGTLYVPDYLSSHPKFTVGDERLGLPSLSRLDPPRETFADCDPARILFGHGTGIFEGAPGALTDAVGGARARFPRALVWNLSGELRAMLGAVWD
ncbi:MULTISPECIES: hypothetical protein [Salinibaculum]|uniref:hypothetical protein n=1 Tax=Salinibaculum TaxID=2732368 RepID=UPI0030D35FCF